MSGWMPAVGLIPERTPQSTGKTARRTLSTRRRALWRDDTMNARSQSLVVSTAVLLTVVTGGCGGETLSLVEVTGTISYQGEPVPNADVMFQPPEAPPAMGRSDEQGSFSLVTSGRPGAAPGPARVAVTAFEVLEEVPAGDADPEGYSEQRSLIPEKYMNVISSPLAVEVPESGGHFDLELTY
jgi:hypothetical protein